MGRAVFGEILKEETGRASWVSESILKTQSLTIRFGGLCAVDHVDFYVGKGEFVGLIGPNGSGKSTFFNLLTGIYLPSEGEILFEGKSLVGEKPHSIVKKGISRTFQNGRLFGDVSALDNVMTGMHGRQRTTLLDTVFRYGRVQRELSEGARTGRELLGFLSDELRENCLKRVMDLPHADRKRVEICRALASDPKLLLLDEPAGGMSPEETEELMNDIRKVKEKKPDLSVIVIEHDMAVIEKVAERVYVFNYGRKIAEGPFTRICKSGEVIEAYLGAESEDD
jgi:branched-chain amino acid transport system ATP-binding protein